MSRRGNKGNLILNLPFPDGMMGYSRGHVSQMKVYLETFGCQMNRLDSELAAGALKAAGHELTDDINGYEARLGWAIKLKRADFIGRDALAAVRRQKSSRLLVGIEMLDRGIPRADYPVVNDGVVIGHVTSGTQSPTLGKPIALALIAREFSALGTELQVDIRGRLRAAAVCRYPFYMRPVSAP